MLNSTNYDVVVIGGGPAGLVCALLMARAGEKVVLVDRPFPSSSDSVANKLTENNREKVGESMPAATNRLLQKLDLPLLTHPNHDVIAGSESNWANYYEQQDFIHHLQGGDWRLDRVKFEDDLRLVVQEQSVDLCYERLINIDKHDGQWCIKTDQNNAFYTNFVIDASGRSGVLSKRLSLTKEKSPALVALWAAMPIDDAQYQKITTNTLIESQDDGWWYAARLPTKKVLAIYHTSASRAADLMKQPHQWLESLQKTDIMANRLPLTQFVDFVLKANTARSSRLMTPYGDGWAACGDAAISFDPISSQGIYNAMASAGMLCKALQQEDRQNALEEYGRRLESVATIYQQKRQQYYQQAYRHHQTDFWQAQLNINA
ncbi:tryptophan 7-halogenase [Marinomonas algicola]|uniref:tryptophan 7-halogenase n=1 Tax=Marinomonas algicola TaxID=2773454 RepID=UPI00174B9003|nr:tryptophan 7-halogenase [Marinomonas algicola]